MDLKKPISLKPDGANSRKYAYYPTKKTINLVDAGTSRVSRGTQIALFCIVIVLVGIFAKVAVIDPLTHAVGSGIEVAAAETQLEELRAANEDYTKLSEEYSRYVVTGLTEEEQNLIDRNTVLSLLESKVTHAGFPASVKVVGNTATVNLLGVDLGTVSRLVEDLEKDDRVAYVTVSTAQSETDSSASATIQISFKGAMEPAEGSSGTEADNEAQ